MADPVSGHASGGGHHRRGWARHAVLIGLAIALLLTIAPFLVVIIIFTVIQSAFGTCLLSSVYDHFPRDLLDAAAIDGAGKWQTLVRIVVPVSWQTVSVLFAFFFIWTWNEFFLPLVFLISND